MRDGVVVVGVCRVAKGFFVVDCLCSGIPVFPLWFPSIDGLNVLVSYPTVIGAHGLRLLVFRDSYCSYKINCKPRVNTYGLFVDSP
jgi:hypothetical protein